MAGCDRAGLVALSLALVLVALSLGSSIATAGPPAAGAVHAASTPGLLTRQGLVLSTGVSGSFESLQVGGPSVLVDATGYRMWYFGCSSPGACMIAWATSADGRSWSRQGPASTGNGTVASGSYPSVIELGNAYWMYFGVGDSIVEATSVDGVTWTLVGLAVSTGPTGSQDGYMVSYPRALYAGGQFLLYYTGISGPTPPNAAIMLATSADGLSWTKQGVVLDRGAPGSPDGFNIFGTGVALVGGTYEMVYLGQQNNSDTRFLYAESSNGRNWTKGGLALAALPPNEALIGQPDLVVAADGTWLVYYAARSGTADLQIYLATGVPVGVGTASGAYGFLLPLLVFLTAGVAGVVILAWAVSRPRRPRR